MMDSIDLRETVLAFVPQKEPFRFIDRIIELTDSGITSEYTFRPDEWFYRGHFPGRPVTPGVIQIEAMAQTAVVAYGIYLVLSEGQDPKKLLTVFTDVQAEFHREIKPGTKVILRGEKIFWRRQKLRSRATLLLEDGTVAAEATLSGIGVQHDTN